MMNEPPSDGSYEGDANSFIATVVSNMKSLGVGVDKSICKTQTLKEEDVNISCVSKYK